MPRRSVRHLLPIAGLGAVVLPGQPKLITVDHAVYLNASALMHHGVGYYEAISVSLRRFIGAPVTPRAFRLPTVFELWRLLPAGPRPLWVAFVVVSVLCGMLAARLSRSWLVPPLVTGYLLAAAYGQFTQTEVWAVGLVLGSVVALRAGRAGWLVGCALTAALLRETAVVLLVGGLLASRRDDDHPVPTRVWVSAVGAWLALYVAHSVFASHHVDAHGLQASLIGTGRLPGTVFTMAGYGVPVVGAAAWVVALWWSSRLPEANFVMPLLLMPLLGGLVDRSYWGLLFVPLVLVYAVDAGSRLGPALRRGMTATISGVPAAPAPRAAGVSRAWHPGRLRSHHPG